MSEYNHQFLGPYIRPTIDTANVALQLTPYGRMARWGIMASAFIVGIVLLVVIFNKFKARAQNDENKVIGVIYYGLFLGSLLTALYGILLAPNSLGPVVKDLYDNHRWVIVWVVLFASVTLVGQVLWPSLSEAYERKIEGYEHKMVNQAKTIERYGCGANNLKKKNEELERENYEMKQENMFL